MTLVLLLIIYLAFISLGLPDALLGTGWPLMQKEFGAPLDTAGLLFMTIAGGTILSSLYSGKLLARYGTGTLTFLSSLLTALSLLGFYVAPSVAWLFLLCIPLGLGAGAVDAALNHYVAAHYKAHHMSWLHAFWGIGASLGPLVMARYMAVNNEWRDGFWAVGWIQIALVALLLVTLPLWGKQTANKKQTNAKATKSNGSVSPFRIHGFPFALGAFLLYCGVEAMVGLWGSSYLVNVKGTTVDNAATWVAVYYGAITVGRILTGFITFKVGNTALIRGGQLLALGGAILLVVPASATLSLIGFILIGLGLAPIYPAMLHETPARFGEERSQQLMGYQMAVAYTGSTFLPPLFGVIAASAGISLFPLAVVLCVAFMWLSTERLNRLLASNVVTHKRSA